MKLFVAILSLVSLHSASLAASAQYTKKELSDLTERARAVEEYQVLAGYYRGKESASRTMAQSDQEDYRRALMTLGVPKFPGRATSANWSNRRNLEMAERMAASASQYEEKVQALQGKPKLAGTEAASSTALTANEKLLLEKVERLERQLNEVQKQ